MSAARDVSPCQRFDRWITAYMDDELDAIHSLEVEDHLNECAGCRERVALSKAVRCSLKSKLSGRCPLALRERISRVLVEAHPSSQRPAQLAATDCETANAEEDSGPASTEMPGAIVATVKKPAQHQVTRSGSSFLKLRHIMPLAAAATVLLVFGVMRLQEQQDGQARPKIEKYNPVATLDHLLEEMVAQHAHPPPPETTDPNGLAKFDPYLGLRVRSPKFDPKNVRYIGARMMPRRHAMLQYMLRDQHRVSLYVFDAKRVPLRANRLKPKHVGARNVYVGNMRGYSVAASERDGVGYVLASDLPSDESAKMVLAAAR